MGTKVEYYRRRDILNEIKITEGCFDCGFNEDPVALHFDHVDGEKKFNIGKSLNGYKWKTIEEEIAKCVVRCANCHAIKTWEQK